MNKNILIVFGGAVVIAFVVALLVQVTLNGKKKNAHAAQNPHVQLLVAAKDLTLGHELKPSDMRWQNWPEASVFPGAILRQAAQTPIEAMNGRLARDVMNGEPLMQTALLSKSKGNFVAASLGPGMRALAIEVSASSMVGGFIDPGDHVDVILTYSEKVNANDDDPAVMNYLELNLEKYATETILQNIRVLAIDQSAQRKDDQTKAKVGKTVTLAVDVQQAEKLSLASRLGDLNLVLRGVGDDQIVERQWPTISDARLTSMNDEIYKGYDEIKKDAGINGDMVRIYKGDHIAVTPAY